MSDLCDKAALIIGGGSGIGAATGRRLAADGVRVLVFGPDREPLQAIAKEVDGVAVSGDAAEPADAKRAMGMAVERFGGLDSLIVCAGSLENSPLVETTAAGWERCMHDNLETAVVTCREGLPLLLARGGGAIVLVSSVGGLASSPNTAGYSTAKAGLIGLMRSIAVDYGPKGIRANAVCPGWVRTPMSERVLRGFASEHGLSFDEAARRANKVIPLRRYAEPYEIAAVCRFLISDEASFVTGSTLVADGGGMAVNIGTLVIGDDLA